jgi:amino acid adenylation domain-containing protein
MTRYRVEKLLELEQLGSEVAVVTGDISEPEGVQRIVAAATKRFGLVNGVIHSAMVLEDKLMQLKEPVSARRVLAPKVQGSLLLLEALRDQPLDFFAHCSSLAAPMGLYAQSDYCAATAFQDALAHWMKPGLGLSINWGVWRDAGFAMRMKLQTAARRQSWQALAGPLLSRHTRTAAGHLLFEGVLSEQWPVAEHSLNGMATLPGTGYISLVNEAMQALATPAFKLEGLALSEPLTVLKAQPRDIRLLLETEPGGYQFKIASLHDERWLEHARGHLSVSERQSPLAETELPSSLGDLKQHFNFSESACASRRVNEATLNYRSVSVGPRWQGLLRWSSTRSNESLGFIELAEQFQEDLRAYPLHPAMLDIATSFAMGDEAFYLPLAYSNVTRYRSFTSRLWSHVRWERNTDSQGPTISFSIKLFNDDGALALEIGDYTLRKIEAVTAPTKLRRLVCEVPGLLDTLKYVPLSKPLLQDDEVEIRVVATGINFLDVLSALNLSLQLPENETGIGRECAGIISSVGRNVQHLKAGDEVIALAANAFDDVVIAHPQVVRLKPTTLSWEVAATVAVPFMTAHFSLHHRAKLKRGESVLIHAAAGGVGLAAIQLALHTGATIYATAGSEEKRNYLRGLGIQHVFDSRSTHFVQEVLAANGGGVDVVLNSLGGDLMLASLGLLAPRGRFLELGKRDFAENRQVGLSVFAQGITYFAINLDPELSEYQTVFDEVLDMVANGSVQPLPVRTYALASTSEAFADMARARHIGKLVVTRPVGTIKQHAIVEFSGIDSPMEDPQLREGMSSIEGSQAFARALSSRLTQVLVTPQEFNALLRQNTPDQIRRAKENFSQVHRVQAPLASPVSQPFNAALTTTNDYDIATIVTESWQKYLGIASIALEDNFFRLGGDSLIGIQIMAYLRKRLGVEVPIAIFFEAPTLKELIPLLEGLAGKKSLAHNLGEAVLKLNPAQRHEPFPLTDVQQAYWIGRSGAFELGNVAAHGYYEIERRELDYSRFCKVWMQLVRRHDMLRMIVNADGQQQTLAEVVDYQPVLLDLSDQTQAQAEQVIADIRERMASQILPSDRWPLFDIRVTLLPDSTKRIHMSFDALIMDAWSSMILGREFSQLYRDSSHALPELELSFRDYVLAERAERETPVYEASKRYWLDRIESLPPAPDLPLAIRPEALEKPSFTRRSAWLAPAPWSALKERAAVAGLTPSVVCLTCFGDVLARWSQSPRFSINLTLFNRPPAHPQINDIVGDFTSLTLLEIDAASAESFIERAQRIQHQLGQDLNHRHFSGIEVLRELVRSGRRHSGAIMPVVFTSTLALESHQGTRSPTIFDGELVYGLSQTPQVWLDHIIVEEEGALTLSWNAVEALFPADLLNEMFETYQTTLMRLASSPDAWQQTLEVPLPAAQLTARKAYNATQTPFMVQRLESGFFAQALLTPNACAVSTIAGDISFQTLCYEASRVANALQTYQLRQGEAVGLHLAKGWLQVAAALGILKAGGAYVPLDPSLPEARLTAMSAGMRLALSTRQEVSGLPQALEALCMDELVGEPSPLVNDLTIAELAYVIFTSGSTGRPKGVMITHEAAMNTIADLIQRFAIGPNDRVLALSALGFDLSVFDIFALLGVGGGIVMPEADGLRDPQHWYTLLSTQRVTLWNSVPALMELLVDYVESNALALPASLRLILLSGDWIPVGLPARIRRLLPNTRLVSLGGATEASIWSIYYPIDHVAPAWSSIPYGYPLANQTYHVLNPRLQDCPDWVTGELYIGGVGLSAGYWHDPEQTAHRFVTIKGERLYRTGDQGRFRPEGWLEFQGRNDHQVKIQGYRIELGEIETALGQHPQIIKCAVKALGVAQGTRKLAAYFVTQADQPHPSADSLRQFLRVRLPDYMIPRTFTPVSSIPLSSNGKVDFASLPAPAETSVAQRKTDSEQSGQRQRILSLIGELLALPHVSPTANLLNLGADSISMIRLTNRLQAEFSIRPSVAELYRMQTIEELLQYCEKSSETSAPQGTTTRTQVASATPLITDPVERKRFKDTHSAVREFSPDHALVALTAEPDDARFFSRRSQRQFSLSPISMEALGHWLAPLRQIRQAGQPKYLYSSAGGLYPVQTYVFVKAGRVSDLVEGLYYHNPMQHTLVRLTTQAVINRDCFDPLVNQPIYDEAAFCLFFVSAMALIEPMYGVESERFASIEAGLMAQVLDLKAPEVGIGLCHIGAINHSELLAQLPQKDRPQLLLAILGGIPSQSEQPGESDKLARALARIAELSPEQVRALLLAKQGQQS